MDENFLLNTTVAQELHHNHAAKMPIIDLSLPSHISNGCR